MKRFKIPIFTEEYKVVVFVGKRDETIRSLARYCGMSKELVSDQWKGRGVAFLFSGEYPVIAVDGDLPVPVCISVLAHEASHAMDSIADYIGIKDSSGEFKAHGVGAIMRLVLKDILKKK